MKRLRTPAWLSMAAALLVSFAGAAQPLDRGTDLIPLTELGNGTYKGQSGGLYGDGQNQPPAAHREAAQRLLKSIVPLDAQGQPSPDGRIVLISIGMSNTTQEFSVFKRLADADPAKARHVVIVDGALGGQDAAAWAEDRVIPQVGRTPWQVLSQRLEQAGVTAAQVQVAWIKQALIGPGRIGEFPRHSERLQQDVATIVRKARERFPNLKIAYLSSRIFAGYATTALNPEPYAYESAFAVRGLIQKQIAGDAELNYDPARGPVKAPLLLWGPYLWAQGETPRKADGLTYSRADLAQDGTHPSASGQQKVANLLLRFFKTDPLAGEWFLAR